jgi:DNA excision repair protein ERCC-3
VWNAAALHVDAASLVEGLQRFSRYPVPGGVLASLYEWHALYGRLVLHAATGARLRLEVKDDALWLRLREDAALRGYWLQEDRADQAYPGFLLEARHRGNLKHSLIKIGLPVHDLCGYIEGQALTVQLRTSGFSLRPYQRAAVDAFHQDGHVRGGNGIVVLPCGAGKTLVGLAVMERLACHTLIVTTNNVSVHQWQAEIRERTQVDPSAVGEYTGGLRDIRPITVTTYQMLTWRRSADAPMVHLDVLTQQPWGLIIYDEVHLLPAPVFRATAEIQARRRLGLTATLVREDHREDDVFALIGPKRYDVPWRVLEGQGFIAEATCRELRIPMDATRSRDYAFAGARQRYRIAAENPRKIDVVRDLLEQHPGETCLIIGQYVEQLKMLAERLNLPVISGSTPHAAREEWYARLRRGDISALVVSKIANFAIDLPDASVLIQVSGTYGSRQEEAQRLGRILRPKASLSASFYSLVTKGTDEQRFSSNRQMFLVEQGYRYEIRTLG